LDVLQSDVRHLDRIGRPRPGPGLAASPARTTFAASGCSEAGVADVRLFLAAALLAGASSPPYGQWLTQDRGGVIEIAACGSALCGRIVGLMPKRDGRPPVDWQGRSDCGLLIIDHMAQAAVDRWRGRILDPEDGRSYDAELWVDAAGQLQLRGFILIPLLGQTQTWTRYDGSVGPACRMG